MLTYKRVQFIPVVGVEGINEVGVYDPTPTMIPSVIGFANARVSKVVHPALAPYARVDHIGVFYTNVPTGVFLEAFA